jgi:hypothetical protein
MTIKSTDIPVNKKQFDKNYDAIDWSATREKPEPNTTPQPKPPRKK